MSFFELAYFHEHEQPDGLRNYGATHSLTATTILEFVDFIQTSSTNPMPSLYVILALIPAESFNTAVNYNGHTQSLLEHLHILTENPRLSDIQVDLENKAHGLSYDNPWKSHRNNNLPNTNDPAGGLTVPSLPESQQPKQSHLTAA